MRLIATLVFLSFTHTAAWAFAPHIANYQLSINGLKIAEEVRTLHQLEDGYFYTANANTSGLAAMIKDYSIAASSTFNINDQGVSSVAYQIMEQEDKKISKSYVIDINSQSKTVSSQLTKTQPKINTWKAKKGNITDPLSIFLAIAFDLKTHPKKTTFSYQIANGSSVETQEFQRFDNQIVNIQGKNYTAIKVVRTNHQGNNIQAYFLKEYRYLPVLIKQIKGGRNYLYEITNLKIPNINGLQVTL